MSVGLVVGIGLMLGTGALLTASPFLWPRASIKATQRGRATERLRGRLALAGLSSVSPMAFIVCSAVISVVIAGFVHGLIGVSALSAGAGFVGLWTPWLLIRWRANVRLRANRAVWPDVVDHLVSAVRSGLALPDSVSTLARVGPAQTRAAFAEFERDYRATGTFAACLDRLKERLGDPVADRILETLRMAREVGGTELTAVLRGLAANLREEVAVRSEVEARQSWVVNAARLGVAAPWVVLILLASRPEAVRAYNSPTGALVIGCGLVLSLIAYRFMIALGRLPEEKRWFK